MKKLLLPTLNVSYHLAQDELFSGAIRCGKLLVGTTYLQIMTQRLIIYFKCLVLA